MPDNNLPPVTPPAAPVEPAAPRHRGYFNRAQLDDLELAETVCAAAEAHSADLAARDLDAKFLTDFAAAAAEARRRAAEAASEAEDAAAATLQTSADAKELLTALHGIQSSAKQKHQMLEADGDPATNFSTDGFLIGTTLNRSRTLLLQSAVTLIARARTDELPGYNTPAAIDAVEALHTKYRGQKAIQADAARDKELARLNRDDLIALLNARRSATQHAADALWPPSEEPNRPTRKLFALPLTRSLGL